MQQRLSKARSRSAGLFYWSLIEPTLSLESLFLYLDFPFLGT
jgi:hypothetical protein